jgi:glyoxylase-like metal-dependent hydrolase (beta-lactamase superfamily II)
LWQHGFASQRRHNDLVKITDSINRAGNDSIVNAYLVEEAGEVTIIDAGMPGMYAEMVCELAAMGRSPADVRAVVLTHGHSDHIGFAERVRREQRVPIWVHAADAALARGEVPNPARGMGQVRIAPLLGFLWFGLLHGGLQRPTINEVSTYGEGATLDLPGSPSVRLVPGHTPGMAVLHVPARDALFVGDAFCTYAVTTGKRGPRIAPFTANVRQALDSLGRLEGIEAGHVLPGHGDYWTGGVAEAIRLVRELAGTVERRE